MRYTVYALISFHKKRFYTYVGYTINLKKRLDLHNEAKGAKFTRGKKWIIIYSKIYKKKYKTKSLAMKNEYKLKKNRKLRQIIKYNFINKNENFNFTPL